MEILDRKVKEMTEERKQELRQLLNEAMEGLQIGVRFGSNSLLLPPTTDGDSRAIQVYFGNGSLPLSRVKLQDYLQKRWTSYGVDSSSVLMYLELYIASDITKSKLLEFIREELASFIHEDAINSVSYAIEGDTDGFCLHSLGGGHINLHILLEHLLKITIAWGVEKAVSTFDEGSSPKGKLGFFQPIASLEGITVKTEIQVCEGIRLVPFPRPTTFELERYFPDFSTPGSRLALNMGKTLLIIDLPMLSIFHNPSEETFDEVRVSDLPFQLEVQDAKLSNLDAVDSFRTSFCQALSLACNSPVQIARKWWFVAEDEIFRPFSGGGMGYSPRLFGGSVKAEQPEIEEAKCLHENLTNLNSKSQKKLQIAIDRWIKSKTYQTLEDKIIDLVIALEALYLPDAGESTFKLAVRASWHLREDRGKRAELFEVFKELYKCRSAVVHGGELKENVPIAEETIPISKFITRTQDLCRESIKKIMKQCLEEGKFPKNDYWDNLTLG
jgi:hypothetical protein